MKFQGATQVSDGTTLTHHTRARARTLFGVPVAIFCYPDQQVPGKSDHI